MIVEATREFAAHGYAGTSTMDIAKRVGVSQPYLFQLFGTKKDLFIAAVQECFSRVRRRFEDVARQARKETDDPQRSSRDGPRLLRLARGPRHACASSCRPTPPVTTRTSSAWCAAGWTDLYDSVARSSGADRTPIHAWFAEGMLMNVAAAVGGLNPEIDAKLKRGGVWPRVIPPLFCPSYLVSNK